MMGIIDMDTGEVITPFLRTPFNYDTSRASDETGLKCEDPSRAQQNFKEDADINTIVERFGLTGQLPENVRVPVSGDFSEGVTDFHSAMNAVRRAEEAFMQMPADVREEFNNDPGRFLKFVEDPANIERARKLGIAKLIEVVPPVEPMLVRVVQDPTEPAK